MNVVEINGNHTDFDMRYRYPREIKFHNKAIYIELIKNGIRSVVRLCGVPDGVDTRATDYILHPSNVPLRLYIYATAALDDEQLHTLDQTYGNGIYPIVVLQNEMNATIEQQQQLPQSNFYIPNNTDLPKSFTSFTECRHFMQRHSISTKCLLRSRQIVDLVLPERSATMLLIMPENFILTGPRNGYFIANDSVIIRIYSTCNLSSKLKAVDNNLVSQINAADIKIVNYMKILLCKLNFHSIVVKQNQIFAIDKFVTAVIGGIENFEF